MAPHDMERIRQIKTFPSLVKYLRDDLGWPIEQDNFDELTFDYEPEELGLDAKTAVKVKVIKQLRPLVTGQPWGIFFINFEPKKLPVVALRRILQSLVLKKRTDAKKSQQATWQLHDLMFISSYGETEHRDLTFAHFADDPKYGDLPILHVLGWDDEDTVLHLGHAHATLCQKMRWPDNPKDIKAWRESWASAFTIRHREVITTAKDMSVQLAKLASRIRKRANRVLAVESEKGPLRKLHKAFKEALIHDLTEDDFADMYAQTISYGLLTARVSRPLGIVAEDMVHMVPVTNPFLKELLETFLSAGGRRSKMDFDELGINEVVETLREANMEAVLRDFGDKNPQEDPVVHFYELFLKEYDPKKRADRGVFYTPKPVVSYIVRSVHELLQTEFGLEDGLAAIVTWGEMEKKHKGMKIPEGVKASDEFVKILDPATGTATFLVEVIDVIYKTLKSKWEKEGLSKTKQDEAWNEYVPKHLLPRLYGYELMMAPYAIAHMKVGLKLAETGYRFTSDERVRIYLTNALESAQVEVQLLLDAPALAHEAAAVTDVKRKKRFTVVIGNPPYSRVSQNQSEFICNLLKDYKKPVADEPNQQPLDDDYIKFVRFAHYLQSATGCGIIGFITNHTIISGILFRGVREKFIEDQNVVAVVDLHGNSNIKEKCIDGSKDENVFDIQAGVSITIGASLPNSKVRCHVFHELWGMRDKKYATLQRLSISDVKIPLKPCRPYYFLKPIDLSAGDELKGAYTLPKIFPCYSSGLMTVRDNLAVAFNKEEMEQRFDEFRSVNTTDAKFKSIYPVNDYRRWSLADARRKVRADRHWRERMQVVNYRPFDKRYLFYSSDIVTYPNFRVMNQFCHPNIGLISSRFNKGEEHAHEFVTREMVEIIFLSSKSSNNAFVFPLYLVDADGEMKLTGDGSPNLSIDFLKVLSATLQLSQGKHGLPVGLTPEDIFQYAYSVLHSPSYRNRYAELLKIDFPRLPLTSNLDLFRALAKLGGELVDLHLMESPKLDKHITKWIGGKNPEVGRVAWCDDTVWIDAPTCRRDAQQQPGEQGFRGVPVTVWNFHIGGYQVCEKWLKDRKGRQLTKDDIDHYQKIVVALHETIRVMREIDEVIEKYGGWPGAFITKKK